jgi:hypothetical protein
MLHTTLSYTVGHKHVAIAILDPRHLNHISPLTRLKKKIEKVERIHWWILPANIFFFFCILDFNEMQQLTWFTASLSIFQVGSNFQVGGDWPFA